MHYKIGSVVDNFRDWLCLFIWADLEKGVFRGRVISWGKVFPEWAMSERVRASSRGEYKALGAGVSDEGYSAVRLQGLA